MEVNVPYHVPASLRLAKVPLVLILWPRRKYFTLVTKIKIPAPGGNQIPNLSRAFE
jgi:hypothetical protein